MRKLPCYFLYFSVCSVVYFSRPFKNPLFTSFHLMAIPISKIKVKLISIFSFLFRSFHFLIAIYFSILILASTATTASLFPNNGFKSISKISGATFIKAATRVTASAKRSSFTGSCPLTPLIIP